MWLYCNKNISFNRIFLDQNWMIRLGRFIEHVAEDLWPYYVEDENDFWIPIACFRSILLFNKHEVWTSKLMMAKQVRVKESLRKARNNNLPISLTMTQALRSHNPYSAITQQQPGPRSKLGSCSKFSSDVTAPHLSLLDPIVQSSALLLPHLRCCLNTLTSLQMDTCYSPCWETIH